MKECFKCKKADDTVRVVDGDFMGISFETPYCLACRPPNALERRVIALEQALSEKEKP